MALELFWRLIFCGLAVGTMVHGFWDSNSEEEGRIDTLSWLNLLGRPHPRPRPPPFFVGNFSSKVEWEWQVNMFRTYECLGLSVEMVNQDIQTSILSSRGDSDDEGRRRSFHLLETAGNLTVWNLTFTLGVQNTTKFQGANVTVTVYVEGRDNLVIRYNSTAGENQVKLDFGPRSREYEAKYRCTGNSSATGWSDRRDFVKGIRHFTRSRP